MVQGRDGAVLGVLEGVDGTLTKQARGPTQDRTLGDWEGGNPDLHAHRDPTTPLPSLPPSGPSLMEGRGRKFFSSRSLGRREVRGRKTAGASSRARMGGGPDKQGLGESKRVDWAQGQAGRPELAEMFLEAWEATCPFKDVHFQIIAPCERQSYHLP